MKQDLYLQFILWKNMQLFCWKFLVIELRQNKPLIKILVIYTYNAGKWDILFITNEK